MSVTETDFITDLLSENNKDEVSISLTASILDTEASSKKQKGGNKPTMSEIDKNLKKMRYRLVSDEEYSAISKMSQLSQISQSNNSSQRDKTITSDIETQKGGGYSSTSDDKTTVTLSDVMSNKSDISQLLSETSVYKELGLSDSDDENKRTTISALLSETSEFME